MIRTASQHIWQAYIRRPGSAWFRGICLSLAVIIFTETVWTGSAAAQSVVVPPAVTAPLLSGATAQVPSLKAIVVDPLDPFRMDFIVDPGGDSAVDEAAFRPLIKYFLTFLTVPEKDLWVNLSPAEPDRIVNVNFGATAAGKDMLLQDYVLKQLAVSLTHPDRDLGRRFWEQVNLRIRQQYGDVTIPVDTINKVWVVPEQAVVYEKEGAAFISESRLKVMLNEDYLSRQKILPADRVADEQTRKVSDMTSTIVREIILPEIEREVNEGKDFASLRQMYHALILAIWFKRRMQGNIVNRVYANREKIAGVDSKDKDAPRRIYEEYMVALKRGAYDLIREEYDPVTQETLPRHYFSGGFSFENAAQSVQFRPLSSITERILSMFRGLARFRVTLVPKGVSKKLLLALAAASLTAPVAAKGIDGNRMVLPPLHQAPERAVLKADRGGTYDEAAHAPGAIIVREDTSTALTSTHMPATASFILVDRENGTRTAVTDHDLKGFTPLVKTSRLLVGYEGGHAHYETFKAGTPVLFGQPKDTHHLGKLDIHPRGDGSIVKGVLLPDHGVVPGVSVPSAPVALSAGGAPPPDDLPEGTSGLLKAPQTPVAGHPLAVAPAGVVPLAAVGGFLQHVQQAVSQQIASLGNMFPPASAAPGLADDDKAAPVPEKSYIIKNLKTGLRHETGTFLAHVSGVVTFTGLAGGMSLHKDQSVMKIKDPELERQRADLLRRLGIAQQLLDGVRDMVSKGGAVIAELAEAQAGVSRLTTDLARVEQAVAAQEIKAPWEIDIRKLKVKEGSLVTRGQEIATYSYGKRASFNIELPMTQTYFGRTHFSINGKPVTMVNVDLKPDPGMTRWNAGVVVELADPLPDGELVTIDGEILPPAGKNSFSDIQGLETISFIRESETQDIPAPTDGAVKFYVRDGEQVVAGQLLAEVDDGLLRKEWESLVNESNQNTADLARALPDGSGVRYYNDIQLGKLKSVQASLKERRAQLLDLVARLRIVAPSNGVVGGVATGHSPLFISGEKLLTVSTGRFFVGDVEDQKTPVLVKKGLVKEGDAVLFEAPSGVRFSGRVDRVGRAVGTDHELGADLESLQVIIEGAAAVPHAGGEVLARNLWGMLIFPAAEDRPAIESALKAIEQVRANTAIDREAQVSQQRQALKVQAEASVGQVSPPEAEPSVLTLPTQREGNLTLADVVAGVSRNQLLPHGKLTIEALKQKAAENLVNPTSLNLTGGLAVNGGHVTWSGGAGGVLDGIGAGLSTGNAVGAAAPVVFNIASELMKHFTGELKIQEELALEMTRIAVLTMQDALAVQVNEAADLFVELGRLQQQTAQWRVTISEFDKERQLMDARVNGAFTLNVTADLTALDEQLGGMRTQLLHYEGMEKDLTIRLNGMMGRTDLDAEIVPKLLWSNGQFQAIANADALGHRLTGSSSPDPRVQAALAAVGAAERTIKLQGLKYLPAGDFTGLWVSGNKSNLNPVYSLVNSATMNQSAIQTGGAGNEVLHFSIPLFSSDKQVYQQMADLQRRESFRNLSAVRAGVGAEFTEIVVKSRNLSAQIEQAWKNHTTAILAWQQQNRRADHIGKETLGGKFARIGTTFQALIDLEAEAYKNANKLSRMGLTEQGLSAVKPYKGNMLSDRLAKAVASSVGPVNIEGPLLLPPLDELPADGTPEQMPEGMLSSDLPVLGAPIVAPGVQPPAAAEPFLGTVTFPGPETFAGARGAQLWSQMTVASGNDDETLAGQVQIDEVVRRLVEDANPLVRQNNLHLLTGALQNAQGYFDSVKNVILHSPYDDVVQPLLQSVVNGNDPDARLLINIISQAGAQGNVRVAPWGFQVLSDMLILHPDAVDRMAGEASVEVDRVLLTFLASAPDDSVARDRVLRSSYWTAGRLARVYNSLKSHEEDVWKELAALVRDEILRRQALAALPDAYSLGTFSSLRSMIYVSFGDVRTAVTQESWGEADRRFLETSPDWRRMERHISGKLFRKANEATDDLLSSAASLSDDLRSGAPAVSGPAPVMLAYFNALGSDAQVKYIAGLIDVGELGRILASPSSLRGNALDRLMESPAGRLEALRAAAGSQDSDLLRRVDARNNWPELLSADIGHGDSRAGNVIYRAALQEMYARTRNSVLLDLRLKTFSLSELHAADDLRGEGPREEQILMEATRMALDTIDKSSELKRNRWKTGEEGLSPVAGAFVTDLKKMAVTAKDPAVVNRYLSRMLKEGTGSEQKIAKTVVNARDTFAADIRKNAHDVPSMPIFYQVLLSTLGVLATWLFFRKPVKKILRSLMPTDALIRELRSEFEVKSGNGNGPAVKVSVSDVVIVPDHELDETFGGPLREIRKLVYQWRHDPPATPVIIGDLNVVLNNAFGILRSMPYNTELMRRQKLSSPVRNEEYQAVLQYLTLLSVDTEKNIDDRLVSRAAALSGEQRRQLERAKEDLLRIMEYTDLYLSVLEYRGIIEQALSKKMPDSDWREKYKIFPVIRLLQCYAPQLGTSIPFLLPSSQAEIAARLPRLFAKGNELMSGLYDDPVRLAAVNAHEVNEVIKQGQSLVSYGTNKMRSNNKGRGFISRAWFFIGPLVYLAGMISGAALGGSIGLFMGIAISLLIFWIPHTAMMELSWSATLKVVLERLNGAPRPVLEGVAVEQARRLNERRNIFSAVQDGMDKMRGELDPAREPGVDMVVIIPEDPQDNDAGLMQAYIDSRRRRIFRGDVPVELFKAERKGSGNAYLEAVAFVQGRLRDPGFIAENRRLNGRSFEDLKVMFVFAGKREQRDDTVLDWAVINGYRIAACAQGECSGAADVQVPAGGRNIVLYARDATFGSVDELAGPAVNGAEEDFRFLGKWVNAPALEDMGLLDIKDGQVRGILEKLVIDGLEDREKEEISQGERNHRSDVLSHLQGKYDLQNGSLKQYPGLTGAMVFGPRIVRAVSDLLEQLRADPRLFSRLGYLNLTLDVLGNFISTEREKRQFLQARLELPDFKKAYEGVSTKAVAKNFRKYSRMISAVKARQVSGNLVTHAVVPYPGAASFFHMNTAEDVRAFGQLLVEVVGGEHQTLPWLLPATLSAPAIADDEALIAAPQDATDSLSVQDAAQGMEDNGGVDLAGTAGILRAGTDGRASGWIGGFSPEVSLRALQLFRGFDFDIISLRPLSDPSNAALLSPAF